MKNVFIIHTHDSGRLISPYGYDLPTDNLLSFAKESALFRNCHTCSPTCSPSRGAMFTGMYPHENGLIGLAHRGFSLNSFDMHMSRFFHEKGYESILCGIQHESEDPSIIGYDQILGLKEYDMGSPYLDMTEFDYSNTSALTSFLSEYDRNKPLFVSMGLYNTHRIFPVDDGSVNPNYITVPKPMFDNEQTRQDMAGYHRSVKIVDDCFGKIIDSLKKYGYYDDSIIVFTTDHGPAFPRMKCTLYEEGTGIAFILSYPGNQSKGRCFDSLISNLDLYPTLCELLDFEIPNCLEGKSLVPILEGRSEDIHSALFSEINYHASYQPMRGIRTKRYKYIQSYIKKDYYPLANIDECLSKSFLMDAGIKDRKIGREELYDLYLDPNEANNLISDWHYDEIKEDLKNQLLSYQQQTRDPILCSGYIKKPKGAFVNKDTCINPGVPDWEE